MGRPLPTVLALVALTGCGSSGGANGVIDAKHSSELGIAGTSGSAMVGEEPNAAGPGTETAPSGRWVVAPRADGAILFRDARSQKVVDVLDPHAGQITALTWSRDSKSFASGTARGVVSVWNEFAASSFDLRGTHGVVVALAFSPDGKLLASTGDDRVVRLWDLVRRRQAAALRPPGPPRMLTWSSDQRQLLVIARSGATTTYARLSK